MEEIKQTGIEKLAAALAKAQAKFVNPEKNSTVKVPNRRPYSYATLDAVLDTVRGPLSDNGIAFMQLVTMRDSQNVLVTKLVHESGQEIEAVYLLPTGLGVQEFGAAITYARRYQACPLLGIAGETDTDGEEAQAAQEVVDDSKKAAAVERLKEIAAKGKLTNANTGKPIKPDEIKKDGSIESTEEKVPMDFPTDPDPVIDDRLRKKLAESKLTLREFKAWGVAKGNFPADMDMSKLNAGFLNTVLGQWAAVTKSIKAHSAS